MLGLVRERSYWRAMNQDIAEDVANCHRCHVAKGHYTSPHTQQGSLVVNNPLYLLFIYFLKIDPSKNGKKGVLLLTDAFSKVSQAFINNNQKTLTVVKTLVDMWFYVCGIVAQIHSKKGFSLENDIFSHLYSMYNIRQSVNMSYNPCGNSQCERFNCVMSIPVYQTHITSTTSIT